VARPLIALASLLATLCSPMAAQAGSSRIGGFVRTGGGGVTPDDAAVVYTEGAAALPLTTAERTAPLVELGFDSQFYPGSWALSDDADFVLGPAFGLGVRLAGVGGKAAVGATIFSGLEAGVVVDRLHVSLGSHVGIGVTSARGVGTFDTLPLDPTPADPTRQYQGLVSAEGTEANVLQGDLPVLPMARVGYRAGDALFLLSVGYRLTPVQLGATYLAAEGGGAGSPLVPEALDVQPSFDPRGAFVELGVYGWKQGRK